MGADKTLPLTAPKVILVSAGLLSLVLARKLAARLEADLDSMS